MENDQNARRRAPSAGEGRPPAARRLRTCSPGRVRCPYVRGTLLKL
ncbi:hypothetical protein PYK79_51255 [Streptomyces sp. ID05-04B]|nr:MULTISPECIES: hypothetical protein [unclassified Streptomyces]MDX5569995.1 hypothetical protein [Streptomyces sp. ID05-04B]